MLDLKTGQKHEIGDWSRRRAHWLAISPDGAWLATSHHHATNVYVYRLGPTPQFVTNLPTGGGRFAFRADGKVLAAGAREALTLWDVGASRSWPDGRVNRSPAWRTWRVTRPMVGCFGSTERTDE